MHVLFVSMRAQLCLLIGDWFYESEQRHLLLLLRTFLDCSNTLNVTISSSIPVQKVQV